MKYLNKKLAKKKNKERNKDSYLFLALASSLDVKASARKLPINEPISEKVIRAISSCTIRESIGRAIGEIKLVTTIVSAFVSPANIPNLRDSKKAVSLSFTSFDASKPSTIVSKSVTMIK